MRAARPLVSPEDDRKSIAAEVRAGLTASPRWLPCHLLYDARGSELFEAITELPEYYLTRTELALLQRHLSAQIEQLHHGSAPRQRGRDRRFVKHAELRCHCLDGSAA